MIRGQLKFKSGKEGCRAQKGDAGSARNLQRREDLNLCLQT